jgi:hypothetical protein
MRAALQSTSTWSPLFLSRSYSRCRRWDKCRRVTHSITSPSTRNLPGEPHPLRGASDLQQSSHDGRLDESGRLHFCLLFIHLVSARVIPITDVSFSRSCCEVHGACDNRINVYPAVPIRLAKVLLAWTIAREGWGSSFVRQIGKCQFAMRTYSHTSDLPDTPDWGVGTQRTVDVIS